MKINQYDIERGRRRGDFLVEQRTEGFEYIPFKFIIFIKTSSSRGAPIFTSHKGRFFGKIR